MGSHGSHGNGSDNDYITGMGMVVGIKVWNGSRGVRRISVREGLDNRKLDESPPQAKNFFGPLDCCRWVLANSVTVKVVLNSRCFMPLRT